jgi:hypothetical protein
MSLFTCQVLEDSTGGQSWAQRWGQAFRGLHQINSFTTVSYNSANHGGKFGHYMWRSPFLWWNNPMKVRDAWAQASIDTQPASVRWATMGPRHLVGRTRQLQRLLLGQGLCRPRLHLDRPVLADLRLLLTPGRPSTKPGDPSVAGLHRFAGRPEGILSTGRNGSPEL